MALVKCPECNREVSDTVRKCPNCGYKLRLHKKQIEQVSVWKKNNKWWKILIAMVIVAILSGGGIACYLYMNSSLRKVQNYLAEGNIDQAQVVFDDKIKSDSELAIDLKGELLDVLSSVIDDYAENAVEYDAYQKIKDFIIMNYEDYDIALYDKQAEEIKTSKTSYDEAKKDQADKKYSDAVTKYQKVVEKDSNYPDAQAQIDQCKSEHKKLILSEIDKQISSDKPSYVEIESSIKNKDYLEEDSDLSAKFVELKERVRDYQISNAEELAKNDEYLGAMEAFNAIPSEFLEDSKVNEAKNNIVDTMVGWVTKKASALARQKKYTKAIELLAQYNSFDTGNTISKQMSSYKKKVKEIVIVEFKELKKKLTLKYDSVDEIYTVVYKGYDPKYINVSRSINIEARAVVDKKEKDAEFQLIAGFQQDDWIFTEQIKFASGKYRETYLIDYSDRYTQVLDNGGGIAEWVYLNDLSYSELFDSIETLVSKITISKKVTLRFDADGKGTRNHTITSSEKSNIKRVYKFCQLLKEYDYLYRYI